MKYLRAIFGLSLLCFAGSQHGNAAVSLTFDWSQIGNGFDGDNLYVVFSGSTSMMTYAAGTAEEELVNFSGNSYDYEGSSYGTSRAFSLSDINTNGFTITSATAMGFYIGYGGSDGLALLSPAAQPNALDTNTSRYSQVEYTYAASSGTFDLTNISQYGGSLEIQALTGSTVTSSVSNGTALTSGEMFQQLASKSGNSSNAVFTQGGQYSRIIGTNAPVTPPGFPGPYNNFSNYLNYLNGLQTVATPNVLTDQITNLANPANPTGTGAVQFTTAASATFNSGQPGEFSVAAGELYSFGYVMSAEITKTGIGESASYGTVISGTMHITKVDGSNSTNSGTVDLTITIPPGVDGDNFITFLYAQAFGQVDATFSPEWANLITALGTANGEGLRLQVAGDLGEAIAAGFAGSIVMVDGGSVELGTLTTYEWWNEYGDTAYGNAQPDNDDYYNQYAGVIYDASNGEVYGTPFDDRFGGVTVDTDGSTTTFNVVLLPDGSTAVPEPGTASLALAGGLAFLAARRRRR